MNVSQAVQHPFGVSTFGSSIVRVEPDIASLRFAVSRLEQHPRDSFRKAHEGAKTVRAYLSETGLNEVGSSRISLAPEFRYSGGEQRFVGYTARVLFHVLLRDLDRMEDVLSGVIDAGANAIIIHMKPKVYLTWNLRHLANAMIRSASSVTCRAQGHEPQFCAYTKFAL